MEEIIIKKSDINLVKKIINNSKKFWLNYDAPKDEREKACDLLVSSHIKLDEKYACTGTLIATIAKYLMFSNHPKSDISLQTIKELLKDFNVFFEE